jgi:hypothetical protein
MPGPDYTLPPDPEQTERLKRAFGPASNSAEWERLTAQVAELTDKRLEYAELVRRMVTLCDAPDNMPAIDAVKALRKERDEALSKVPTEAPPGTSVGPERLLLNAYGRRCYDAGREVSGAALAAARAALAEVHRLAQEIRESPASMDIEDVDRLIALDEEAARALAATEAR